MGVDDNIMTAAAAADMSQWVVAEVIKQELTDVPGWDNANNWNFMEPKDADKVGKGRAPGGPGVCGCLGDAGGGLRGV